MAKMPACPGLHDDPPRGDPAHLGERPILRNRPDRLAETRPLQQQIDKARDGQRRGDHLDVRSGPQERPDVMQATLRERVGDVRRSVHDDERVLHDDGRPERRDEDRDGATPPELLYQPGIQCQPGEHAGRCGDQGSGRNVLVEERLPGIGGAGSDR